MGVGICKAGTQSCVPGGTRWTDCSGEVGPASDMCDGLDNNCNSTTDEGCACDETLTLDISGDCVTARCPSWAPYPVGCNIIMVGGDHRGCVASLPKSPVVFFKEGNLCDSGHLSGQLLCSCIPGPALNASNCPINKETQYYATDRSQCPK